MPIISFIEHILLEAFGKTKRQTYTQMSSFIRQTMCVVKCVQKEKIVT